MNIDKKFVPVMITVLPIVADKGENEVIVGSGLQSTVKSSELVVV